MKKFDECANWVTQKIEFKYANIALKCFFYLDNAACQNRAEKGVGGM